MKVERKIFNTTHVNATARPLGAEKRPQTLHSGCQDHPALVPDLLSSLHPLSMAQLK